MANEKVDRSAFLYMEHREGSYGDPHIFAQCGSCLLFCGSKRNRCYILGKDLEVKAEHTCGLYTNGKPQEELLSGNEIKSSTPKEAGFEKRAVRCENCAFFNPYLSACKLFFILDTEFPDTYNFGSIVSPTGCCDANLPIGSQKKDAISGYISKVLNKKVELKDIFK